MLPLEGILAQRGSSLAELTRYGLVGLRAMLARAVADNATDPAAEDVRQLLAGLDLLLAPPRAPAMGPPLPAPQAVPVAVPIPATRVLGGAIPLLDEGRATPNVAPAFGSRLEPLRDAVARADVLRNHVGNAPLRSSSDEELWSEVQRLILRLPGALAQTWRQQAERFAQQVGAVLDHSPGNAIVLPWTRDEEVYPGLNGAVQARGLRFDRNAPLAFLPADVAIPEGLHPLACAVALCLSFIDCDPNLHHALKAVQAFGVNTLTDEDQRNRYKTELLFRFRRVLERDEGSEVEALWARIDLDEALHSLLYLPPVNRDTSWWGKLQQEMRRTLDRAAERTRQAGSRVQLQTLWGPYAKICDRSSSDLEVDSGFPLGEVVSSLRVFAQVAHEAIPGRVLYRSVRSR